MAILRPNYFQRQQVTAADLNQLFDYDASEWQKHNLRYHGCGVVCGLVVKWIDLGKTVSVTAGYAVGPQGDEILVPTDQVVAVDCVELVQAGCLNPDTQAQEQAVYITIRYITQPDCYRPITPACCAPNDECQPTRLRSGFEIACRTSKPQDCQPRMELDRCSAHALLRSGRLVDGGTALGPFFTCEPETEEEWLVLTTITYTPEPSGKLTPHLTYADRTYLPSTQYLMDLVRILGAQALKRQVMRQAITSIGDVSGGTLRINRGRVFDDLTIRGRGLEDAVSVRLEPPSFPAVNASIVLDSVTNDSLRINLRVPVDTPAQQVALVVTLSTGVEIKSNAQETPILLELFDNPIELLPLSGIDAPTRGRIFTLLRASGFATAQRVATVGVSATAQALSTPGLPVNPFLPWQAFSIAVQVVRSASQWLADGAPE